jgi:hypothetical protein
MAALSPADLGSFVGQSKQATPQVGDNKNKDKTNQTQSSKEKPDVR